MDESFARSFALVLLLALVVLPMPAGAGQQGWPAYVNGRRGFHAGGELGYFIWHDDDGWHIRWTTGGRTHGFTGEIRSDGALHDVKAVRTEKGDVVVRAVQDLVFRATSTGGVDGFDFRTKGDRVTFRLRIDELQADRTRVSVGAAGIHPGNPFTVVR
jgi:hypothetical protein